MTCPKCHSQMQTVNKGGVHIEQCQGCRGIFLDRGELEQIAGAETAYYQQATPPPYQPDVPPGGGWGGGKRYSDSPKPYRGGYGDSPRPYGHGQRRRRSFLENLFD
ncbi:MAG: transcriptional regulator [Streptosporangiales bacterium]|nr:transcriptional regulator [Streptosporangiales bacterium]